MRVGNLQNLYALHAIKALEQYQKHGMATHIEANNMTFGFGEVWMFPYGFHGLPRSWHARNAAWSMACLELSICVLCLSVDRGR